MKSIVLKSGIDVTNIQCVGGDHMIVAAAKVSTNGIDCLEFAREDKVAENRGLINYLVKMRHGTPFEHGSLTFFVHAPIFVWREWHRHRIGFSYNEESARYKKLEPIFHIARHDRPMMKVEGWKPGRPKFLCCEEPDLYQDYVNRTTESYRISYDAYEANLADGFDPGLARECLPVGIYSGCWVTCNPRSLMAFLSLRTHCEDATYVSYPLYEINEAANKVEEIFASLYPITHEAFVSNGRVAP